MVCVFSTTAGLTFANKFFVESSGWPAARLRDFARLVHPHDRDRTISALRRAVAESSDFRGEFRFRFPDGGYRTFFCTAAPLLANGGVVRGLYGIAIDIEDRVQTRTALLDSERRLETFLTTVPQIVWTADSSGTIDWYNDRWYEFTGQTPEEAAGWGWQAVHHPEDFPRVMEEWPRCIATGDPFEMEFRLLGRDGYRWFLTRITPLKDERGNVIRWFGANTDIDDRKRAEQRLVAVLQEVFRNERAPDVAPLRIDALYLPAEPKALVGGDWYDTFALADGRLLVSIGDVAGHGIEAASTAARLRQTVAAFALEDPDPARVLERTNRVCAAQNAALATACVAVIDPRTLHIAYATAGHPPPVFALAGASARGGELGGLPLGSMPDIGATTHRTTVASGTHAVFFTDGLTEYSRQPVEGERRLMIAAETMAAVEPDEPARWLRERVVGAAAMPDDIAIVVVSTSPAGESRVVEDERSVWRFHSSDPFTAQRSRRAIYERIADAARRDRQALGDMELIVGELLANTVEHAPGLVEVEFERDGDALVLTVSDSGPGLVVQSTSLPGNDAESGRGLYLVRTLSRDVHFGRTSRGGTLVRVVLPLDPKD